MLSSLDCVDLMAKDRVLASKIDLLFDSMYDVSIDFLIKIEGHIPQSLLRGSPLRKWGINYEEKDSCSG